MSRPWFETAAPVTFSVLLVALIALAALVNRLAPRKKKRVRRATILLACYGTAFLLGEVLGHLPVEAWARRVWFAADLLAVVTAIDLVAVFLFDVLLVALHLELTDIVHDLARGGAYALAAISALRRSGMDFSSLVATSAVVTGVVALSLQATLGNILGGVALQLDDSIHTGDWIQLPNGVQGRVKAIRWRHTELETRNWDTIIVPNSTLLAEQIVLLGHRDDQPRLHRMWVWFHVDYRFAPEEVLRVVDEAVQAAPIACVAAEPRPHALCMDLAKEGFGGVAAYAVRFWLADLTRDDPASSDVRARIYAALKRAQIPLALPGQAVFVTTDDAEHAARKDAREMARRAAVLEHIELFASLSTDERQQLASRMKLSPFGPGELITQQGSPSHWLYVLTRGEVEVKVHTAGGVEQLVRRLSAPDVFGEMGMMTGEPRTASVVAATDADCYRIDKAAFQELVRVRPAMVESISTVMARRRVELMAVREHLDAATRQRRVEGEKSKMLSAIQDFFGLKDS